MKKGFKQFSLVIAASLFLLNPVYAIDIGVFADITLSSSDVDGETTGFGLGQFDVFASQQLGENDRAFFEFVFEDADGFVIDLERIWVEHSFGEGFNLLGGRYHTPLGYWNRTYHHGAMLQDTTGRPEFLDFEDGPGAILPTHMVGVMAKGLFQAGGVELGYEIGVGNGGSINTENALGEREIEMNNTSDPNDSKSVAFRFIIAPYAVPLQVGLFAMANNMAESGGTPTAGVATGSTLIDQTIVGFDFKYSGDVFSALTEFYNLTNDSNGSGGGLSGSSETGTAFFAQFGLQFGQFKTVFRYETVSIEANDDYFTLLSKTEQDILTLGLNFAVDESNALKFEIARHEPSVGTDSTSFALQWAFLIP